MNSVTLSRIVDKLLRTSRSDNYMTIVHIGPSKTGSSAIQEALNRSRGDLAKHRILYPGHAIDTNLISSGHLNTILSFSQSGWRLSRRKIARILGELADSNCNKLILSSEFFANGRLLNRLSNSFENLVAVAYIRDAISLLGSEYIQSIKRSTTSQSLRLNNDGSFQPWFYQRIEDCATSGVELKYLKYPTTVEESAYIADSLLHLASYSGPPLICQRVNIRYSLESLALKRFSNQYLDKDSLIQLDVLLQNCPIGEFDYNVLTCEQCEIVRSATDQYIERLRSSVGLPRLAEAIQNAQVLNSSQAQPSSCIDNPSYYVLISIIHYIEEHDPGLLAKLRKSIEADQNRPEKLSQIFYEALL